MAIISKLKALVGLDSGDRSGRGTTVTVEREVAAESERAVKEPTSSGADSPESTDTEPTDEGVDEPVDTLSGIGPAYAERLGEAGIDSVGDLAAADAAELAEATGVGEGRLAGWIDQARNR